MEMHQVRYFLAVSRHLNFTRAAKECNVSQPSLTRAVKLLELELGGELLRRERGLTHLTELGERMLPLLTSCYESAAHAKSIAEAMQTRQVAALRLALMEAVDVAPFLPHLTELLGAFGGLSLKLLRAAPADAAELLREGGADLVIGAPQAMKWERFESWPLFTEPLRVALPSGHRFANRAALSPEDLTGETLVLRRHCDTDGTVRDALGAAGVDLEFCLEVGSERDAAALLEAGAGIAIVPASVALPAGVRSLAFETADPSRELRVFAVRGRKRSASAALLLTQLRAADWSRYERAEPNRPSAAGAAPVAATA